MYLRSCVSFDMRYGGTTIGEYQMVLMPPMHLHTWIYNAIEITDKWTWRNTNGSEFYIKMKNNSWLKLYKFKYYHKNILLGIFHYVCRHLKLISLSDKISKHIFLNKIPWLPLAVQPQGPICIQYRVVPFLHIFWDNSQICIRAISRR